MDSGTVRAREVQTATPRPQPAKPQGGSRSGLFLGIAVIGMLLLAMAVGGFLLLRLLRGGSSEPPTSVATASTGAVDIPATPPPDTPSSTPPAETEPPAPTPAVTLPAASEPEKEKEPPPPPRETPALPVKVVKPVKEEPPAETPPPRTAEVPPQPAPVAPQAIPEKPTVSIECDGVKDACSEIRSALQQALEKKGMRTGRAAGADVLVSINAEEVEARTEEQFGNTFVVRTYSVTLDGDVPRFGDSVSIPPRTFSFDARLGRDKLRGEAHVIATSAAERIEKYWETKR
jgi:hypothetical protein